MAILNNWRLLYASNKPFLAALEVSGHIYIPHGPIITSVIVEGDVVAGGTVKTASGTVYHLQEPLSEDEDCEFARNLLIERVSKNFAKQGTMLKLEQLDELFTLIDQILSGERM
jgi:hypothetical protein